MNKFLVGLVLTGLLAGAAFGQGWNVVLREAGSGLSTVDLGPAASASAQVVNIQVFMDAQGTMGTGNSHRIIGVQARITGPAAVRWNPATLTVDGFNIDNYASPYDKNPTATAFWAGILADDGLGNPAMNAEETAFEVIPGGPLPSPLWGSTRANSGVDHAFLNMSITIPAGTVYPVLIAADKTAGTGTVLTNLLNESEPVLAFTDLLITPEPVSALLLLAGLPLLRRRR